MDKILAIRNDLMYRVFLVGDSCVTEVAITNGKTVNALMEEDKWNRRLSFEQV